MSTEQAERTEPCLQTPNNTTITIENHGDKDGTPSNQSAVSSLPSISTRTEATRRSTAMPATPDATDLRTKSAINGLDTIEEELNRSYSSDDDVMVEGIESLGHSMPRYCVTTRKKSSLGTFTVDMKNVLLEMEESGDGGDSDVEGDLAEELDDAVQEAVSDKRSHIEDQEVVEFSDRNIVKLSSSKSKKWNSELEKYIPSIPDNWKPDDIRSEQGEPEFDQVDNPGNWNDFIFSPEFELGRSRAGTYKGHFLPIGATPVPISSNDGTRSINDWQIFYNGWEDKNKNGRMN